MHVCWQHACSTCCSRYWITCKTFDISTQRVMAALHVQYLPALKLHSCLELPSRRPLVRHCLLAELNVRQMSE